MGVLTEIDPGLLRDAAGRAADVIVENAITAGGRSTWLGATFDWVNGDLAVVSRTGDASLYEGSAGIALAAWTVSRSLGRDDLGEIAVGAARHALSARDRLMGNGLFDGQAGIGLAALEVGAGADDEALMAAGLQVLQSVGDAAPVAADLVAGSAGAILALLAAARRTGSERWVASACSHGEHLLATAERLSWGWGWSDGSGTGPPLCGLAHGSAGIAWALGELAAATEDERFAAAADSARRYERSWFDARTSSWPDLRSDDSSMGGPPPRPALWCHGAVGIGLSRLALHGIDPQPWLAAEAAAALQSSTAEAGALIEVGVVDAGLTMCHGLGGTMLLLLGAHSVLGEPEHLNAARWVAERALGVIGADPSAWPSGVRGGGFSPGLMTGLAGTMYVLARAADPAAVGALDGLGV